MITENSMFGNRWRNDCRQTFRVYYVGSSRWTVARSRRASNDVTAILKRQSANGTQQMRPENQLCIPFATTGSDFGSGFIAGFECGLVHGGRPDLLVTTGHTPDRQMLEHFKIVRSHGSATVRNGLVPGHNAVARLETARDAGLTGIWDLSHYHRNVDPVRCARVVAAAALSVRGMSACGCVRSMNRRFIRCYVECRATSPSRWQSPRCAYHATTTRPLVFSPTIPLPASASGNTKRRMRSSRLGYAPESKLSRSPSPSLTKQAHWLPNIDPVIKRRNCSILLSLHGRHLGRWALR